MRDVLNLNPVEYQLNDYTIISFDSLPEYDRTDYDLGNEKEFNRYILDIKADARKSFEYQRFMTFLKTNLDMNRCSFFENIAGGNRSKIKIEIHHDPFTIEDIIRIVYRKRSSYYEVLDEEQVSKEVMFLHYNLLVGLIPASTTVHELIGNNYLFVPTTHIMGNYKDFANRYEPFIDNEMIGMLQRIEEATEVYDHSRAENILKKHYVYINVGDTPLPTYDTIIQMMRDRLDELNSRRNIVMNPYDAPLRKPFIKVDEEESSKIELL